jgi:FkbM family methyltransferase
MLLALPELVERYRMKITGVVHVGAHIGQEAEDYEACGIEHVLWIEANPALMGQLNEHVYPYGHVTACACVGARDGEPVTLHLAESPGGLALGQSSSVLPLGTHAQVHPEVRYVGEQPMLTQTLATLLHASWPWAGAPQFMNLDVQGYELECLKGAEPVLASFKWIYAEINEDPLYEGCALLPELEGWLGERGFRLAEKKLWGAQTRAPDARMSAQGALRWYGWGDALFVRA